MPATISRKSTGRTTAAAAFSGLGAVLALTSSLLGL
jgi:hypothetical protein